LLFHHDGRYRTIRAALTKAFRRQFFPASIGQDKAEEVIQFLIGTKGIPGGGILLSAWRRIHIVKAIFFTIVYYLCFYEEVFEYQWSVLAYVLAICVVLLPEFQTRFSIFCCLLICFPSCFLLLSLLHFDVQNVTGLGLLPDESAWEWMVVSTLLPLFLLCGSVLLVAIKPLLKRLRRPVLTGS
jgi:hypothetical protein